MTSGPGVFAVLRFWTSVYYPRPPPPPFPPLLKTYGSRWTENIGAEELEKISQVKWFPDLSALIENSDHFHPPTVYPFCSCYDQSHQMWNFTWKTSSFVSVIDIAQGAEMDLNTKSWPKQKTIKSLIYKTQGFQITINENPPCWKFFSTNFGCPEQGSNRRPLY